MKKAIFALMAAVLMLGSCGNKAEEMQIPEGLRMYACDNVNELKKGSESVPFDRPLFTLYPDGTFTFQFSLISSYSGHGTYEETADELILSTEDGLYTYRFAADGDSYVFNEENSSEWTHYANMPDGAVFRGGEVSPLPEDAEIVYP